MEGVRYSLIGLDILVTPEWQLKVLEANAPPSLSEGSDEHEISKAIKLQVQADFHRLVIVGLGADDAEHGGFVAVDGR